MSLEPLGKKRRRQREDLTRPLRSHTRPCLAMSDGRFYRQCKRQNWHCCPSERLQFKWDS